MTRVVRAHPEEQLQRAMVRFFGVALPPDAVCWHTPNQRGTRAKWENSLLKGLGVLAGIPDLLILWNGRLIGLELKAPGGFLTNTQKETQERLRAARAWIATVRSVEDAERFLRRCGVPLRATVLPNERAA